jgi:ATP phosphoribosyltransferase
VTSLAALRDMPDWTPQTPLRVVTGYHNIAKRFFASNGFRWGGARPASAGTPQAPVRTGTLLCRVRADGPWHGGRQQRVPCEGHESGCACACGPRSRRHVALLSADGALEAAPAMGSADIILDLVRRGRPGKVQLGPWGWLRCEPGLGGAALGRRA